MEELNNAISDLPPWLQLIILIAVVFIGVLFGKRNKKPANKPAREPNSGVVLKPKTTELIFSPGQIGPEATRDLSQAEISKLKISYAPDLDNDPDPGEVVWTWVPFVENDGRGKDRPVLIIARIDANTVAGCYMSTKEHRGFIEVGPGPWDKQGRVSYLSTERFLRITHDGMRREGSTMPKDTFERVTKAIRL